MKNQRWVGIMLILGAVSVFIPYTLLTIIFDYPDILREDPGIVLTKFYEGGSQLIAVWWAFAILGMPLIVGYLQMGEWLKGELSAVKWITTVGVIGLVVQMLGLLRWVFVVPVLANHYVHGDASMKVASALAFEIVHQYGGVVLGEHIGQLFTIIWTIGMSYASYKLKAVPNWMTGLGYVASAIYLLAQTELFATVIPGFPVVSWAGFVGSTLWLVWLLSMGVHFLITKKYEAKPHPL